MVNSIMIKLGIKVISRFGIEYLTYFRWRQSIKFKTDGINIDVYEIVMPVNWSMGWAIWVIEDVSLYLSMICFSNKGNKSGWWIIDSPKDADVILISIHENTR